MAYAAQADLERRFGVTEILQLSDRDGDGSPDAGVIAGALTDAANEIDGYLLGGGYTLPLTSVPAALTLTVCDVARYRLYDDAVPDEPLRRYERAISWLKDVAAGRVKLFADDAADAPDSGTAVVAPARVFTADSLDKFM